MKQKSYFEQKTKNTSQKFYHVFHCFLDVNYAGYLKAIFFIFAISKLFRNVYMYEFYFNRNETKNIYFAKIRIYLEQ